jgi:hypothetical protein
MGPSALLPQDWMRGAPADRGESLLPNDSCQIDGLAHDKFDTPGPSPRPLTGLSFFPLFTDLYILDNSPSDLPSFVPKTNVITPG